MVRPEIISINAKKLVGLKMSMSLLNNKTFELFSSFMPRLNEVQNRMDNNVLDLREYPKSYFDTFSPAILFTKWALVEVNTIDEIPSGMESYVLRSGNYARFEHIGGKNRMAEKFQYIFREWLPSSGYEIDQRPHFEILPKNYKADDINAKDWIYIPIR